MCVEGDQRHEGETGIERKRKGRDSWPFFSLSN